MRITKIIRRPPIICNMNTRIVDGSLFVVKSFALYPGGGIERERVEQGKVVIMG